MRWGIHSGNNLHFAWLPVRLEEGGWAWLEWVRVKITTPKAFGVLGDVHSFHLIPAAPTTPPPPKPKR